MVRSESFQVQLSFPITIITFFIFSDITYYFNNCKATLIIIISCSSDIQCKKVRAGERIKPLFFVAEIFRGYINEFFHFFLIYILNLKYEKMERK